MNQNHFPSYLNCIVDSLNQCKSHILTVSEYSSRLKLLSDKTEDCLNTIETSYKSFSEILTPIQALTSEDYLRYKNSVECSQLLDYFVKLHESLKVITKIITKDGYGQTNKLEYFESVRKIKRSSDFLHANAPGNPSLSQWRSLMDDAIKVLGKEIDIELNNSTFLNLPKLKSSVYNWIDTGVRCNILESEAIFFPESSVENISSIIKLLDDCEYLQSAVESYALKRCIFYKRIFDMLRREDKLGDELNTTVKRGSFNEEFSPTVKRNSFKQQASPQPNRSIKNTLHISGMKRISTSIHGNLDKTIKQEFTKSYMYDYLAAIMAAFVLLFKFEIKYAARIIPELHFNNVLLTIYSDCAKTFQEEIEATAAFLVSVYQNGDLNMLTTLFKSVLPVITFTFQLQEELLSYAKGSPFVHIRKIITQFTQPIESAIVSASQEYRNLITNIYDKGSHPVLLSGGVFDYVIYSQDYFLTIATYSKSFAFCFFKLVKTVTFSDVNLNWYSYLHNYTNTSFDILKESIIKNASKTEMPLKSVTLINNFEYLIDFLNMDETSEIFSKDFCANTISNIKKYIKYEIGLYRDSWEEIFREMYEHTLTVQKDLKDAQVYGKQLTGSRKSATKNFFKNLNNGIESYEKKHEGLSIYHPRVTEEIRSMMFADILSKYTTIYQCYIDVPFSHDNKKYIKYDIEQFTQILQNLVWSKTQSTT